MKERSGRKNPLWLHACRDAVPIALLLLIALWTFWGVRLNPFHFDDALFLQNPQVTTPGNPWYLLRPSQSRQLTYLSFYWNHRICGVRPEGYHLFNLLLHCLNTIGVYAFTFLLCRLKSGGDRGEFSRLLALVAAGIFALHPVQSEAVNYVYQRSTLLAATFTLAALISFLLSTGSKRTGYWSAAAAVFVVLAALSKETALATPLLMVLLAWVYFAAPTASPPILRRSRLLLFALSLLALAGAGWVLYTLHQKGEGTIGIDLIRNLLGYLISQAQVAAAYLRLILWPTGLVIDHAFRPALPLSAYSLSCWLLLLGGSALLVHIRRVQPEVSFWGLGFLLLLVPTSSVIPSADLMFEHRLYLPMITGSALLAWLLYRACRQVFKPERVSKVVWLALAATALVSYALVSRERTFVWGDNVRLWSDAVAKVPSNARAHYNLGVAYLSLDRRAAYREFQETVELQPTHAAAIYNLGWLDQTDGRLDAARGHYEAAIRADPAEWRAHLNLANLNVLQGRSTDAVKEYQAAIRLRKDSWMAYESLASLQIQTGNPGSALATLEALISMQPDRLEARYLKAYALARAMRREEAEAELRAISSKDQAGVYARKIRELRAFLDASSARQGQP